MGASLAAAGVAAAEEPVAVVPVGPSVPSVPSGTVLLGARLVPGVEGGDDEAGRGRRDVADGCGVEPGQQRLHTSRTSEP